MALIKCPECGREISDKAPVCPHCGYCPPSVNSVPSQHTNKSSTAKETGVGPSLRKPFTGCVAIVLGILGVPSCFVFPPIGIIMVIGSLIMIVCGFANLKGYSTVVCPYCGSKGQFDADYAGYTCPACHKRSVYIKDKNVLRTVE